MSAYVNRPDFAFQMAFGTDPNDPAGAPVWQNFTSRCRSASAVSRGRQYELAQTLPSSPQVLLRDVDEELNSANTSSPYSPNIVPYRSVLWQGMWPQTTGNLINTAAWRPNDADVWDPTFESASAGSLPSWVIKFASGPAPVIQATGGRSGPHCLAYTATIGLTSGTGWAPATIPGRQYTASAYVNQNVANTVVINAQGVVTGTSTTTTGSYVRLSVTFTAQQPVTQILVFSASPTIAGTTLIDDIQLEPGAAATTFTTTGPVIYPIMANYAERFVKTWLDNGYTGYVTLPCVDALTALASIKIKTEYTNALAATSPAYTWTMGTYDATGRQMLEANGGPPLIPALGVGKPQQGQVTTNYPSGVVGDPGVDGVGIVGSSATNQGITLRAKGLSLVSTGPTWSLTLAIWLRSTDDSDTIGIAALSNKNGNMTAILREGTADLHPFGGTVYVPTAGGNSTAGTSLTYIDDHTHMFVLTNTLAAGVFTTNLYVDGALQRTDTSSAAAVFGTAQPSFAFDTLEICSGLFGYDTGDGVSGAYSHAHVWRRAITATEVSTLYQAGAVGFAGETSGTRVKRHFALGNYTPYPPRSQPRINPGTSIMQAPSWTGQIDLATDFNNNTIAEGGCSWIGPDGVPVFEGRQQRWLRTSPMWTLGNTGSATPFDPSVEYDTDPTFVFSDVEITRNGGITAIGGSPADIATAIKKFFDRSYTASVDLATDALAQDFANWTFYTHNGALQRINVLILDPASNPALWPIVLGIENGQRIRVSLTSPAANHGAGFTNVADFFVENVTHDGIDMDTGTWRTMLLLSPIGAPTGAISFQPWILGDSTLGVLGSTTRLGW